MNMRQFQSLLDGRGPEIARWPEADRVAAEALLATSAEARAALAEAEALHRALTALTEEPASPLLRSAILDIPELHDQAVEAASAGWSPRRRGIAAGWTAIAASAAIGFAVGVWWPVEQTVWQSEDLVALVYGRSGFDEVLR